MNVGVVGTGYVGLVSGTGFAERGNDVTCMDVDADKVARLQAGEVPIYEPGLRDIIIRNVQEKRLHFTTDLNDVAEADVVFLALPTPQGEDGSADLSYIEKVALDLGPLLTEYTVIVNKSTVPVGTAQKVEEIISNHTDAEFDVVSNPEFLREGQAIDDFLHPDRVVIGTSSERAAKVMTRLYEPFVHRNPEARLMVMDTASAELAKYAANTLLAARISFMNGLTELAERTGADIGEIRRAVGADSRIGSQFLYAGPGYGGSCFPKDTHALLSIGQQYGLDLEIVRATINVNEQQKQVIPEKVLRYYGGDVKDKKFVLWGLAFKDNTDDTRESPALTIVDVLTNNGANIIAFDPQAMDNVRRSRGDNEQLSFATSSMSALKGADALIIATNWSEFMTPDFKKIKASLKAPVIFDGRNLYDPKALEEAGFHYESIGRRTIN